MLRSVTRIDDEVMNELTEMSIFKVVQLSASIQSDQTCWNAILAACKVQKKSNILEQQTSGSDMNQELSPVNIDDICDYVSLLSNEIPGGI